MVSRISTPLMMKHFEDFLRLFPDTAGYRFFLLSAPAGKEDEVTRTLEDAPFYARSLVASQVLGKPAIAVHESLSLTRFRAAWVRMLLPFRMPRRR